MFITFKTAVAIKVVNELNRAFKKYGTTNRAFLETPFTVQIDPPAGFEVDVVDNQLDLHNGVYGDTWFAAPEHTA